MDRQPVRDLQSTQEYQALIEAQEAFVGPMSVLQAREMERDQDSQLMLAVKDGDRQAFAALFRKYSGPLFHFVFRFVGNGAVAEELVQEIFFKIYRAAPKYQPRSKFSTFLYRVATNHCLNEVRRADYKRRFESIEASREDEASLVLPDPDEAGAHGELEAARLAQKVQSILVSLPDNQRAALLLHRMDALSYQQIAEALGCSVGAVKSLIHRAKQTLQERLEVWNEEAKRI